MGYAEGQADGLAAALAYRYQLRPGQLTEARAQSFDADYAQALTELRKTLLVSALPRRKSRVSYGVGGR